MLQSQKKKWEMHFLGYLSKKMEAIQVKKEKEDENSLKKFEFRCIKCGLWFIYQEIDEYEYSRTLAAQDTEVTVGEKWSLACTELQVLNLFSCHVLIIECLQKLSFTSKLKHALDKDKHRLNFIDQH